MTSPSSDEPATLRFVDLALPAPLLQALTDVGYESPSPIQAATIPPLLDGRDLLGQAQTGTGKTAAFALPILARLDATKPKPQALVLAPTRELAIQVAEAFQRYATHLPGFHVLPIYGGQSYGPQLGALRRGVQVVVGTPGRVIDHLERGSLDLSELCCLVLDEADEMLRMGFIDDVEAVLKKTPPTRQIALFSATMPPAIRRIAQTYLRDPVEIAIKNKTTTAANTRQRYWLVSGLHKLDALTRILEAEPFDAMIVFARTKHATEELAEKLSARGFSAAAINGDIAQPLRERAIQRLKDGQLDILVATDVAARGLDVDRISHVLNYDIPYDTESYVHRIGRTGRAGRSGEAILFVAPRERGMLRTIERATRQPIEQMTLPSVEAVNDQRVSKFLGRITDTLAENEQLDLYRGLIERYEAEHNVPAVEIAAALARLLQGDSPLLLEPVAEPPPFRHERDDRGARERPERARPERFERDAGGRAGAEREPRGRVERERLEPAADGAPARRGPPPPRSGGNEPGMQRYRIEVGYQHGVKPGNIVGAIANEAGIESRYIGRIDIHDAHSVLDLPEGMPDELQAHLQKVRVAGQALRLRPLRPGEDEGDGGSAPRRPPFAGKGAARDEFRGPPRGPRGDAPRGDGPPRSFAPRDGAPRPAGPRSDSRGPRSPAGAPPRGKPPRSGSR